MCGIVYVFFVMGTLFPLVVTGLFSFKSWVDDLGLNYCYFQLETVLNS